MQTKSTKASKSEIYSVIDISEELKGVPASAKEDLKDQLGELLVEQILESLASTDTPIQGGKYKATLSKDYAAKKKAETGSSAANLDLSGEMLNAIDYKIQGNTIKIGVFGRDNAGKADGHNNFSGRSNLPTRQFLPEEGQQFKKDIRDLIAETVDGYKSDVAELDSKKLDKIESKGDLYAYLADELGITSKSAIREAVLGSKNLMNILDDFDLVDLL